MLRRLALMASFVAGCQGMTKDEAAAWHAEFAELGRQGRYFFQPEPVSVHSGEADETVMGITLRTWLRW